MSKEVARMLTQEIGVASNPLCLRLADFENSTLEDLSNLLRSEPPREGERERDSYDRIFIRRLSLS